MLIEVKDDEIRCCDDFDAGGRLPVGHDSRSAGSAGSAGSAEKSGIGDRRDGGEQRSQSVGGQRRLRLVGVHRERLPGRYRRLPRRRRPGRQIRLRQQTRLRAAPTRRVAIAARRGPPPLHVHVSQQIITKSATRWRARALSLSQFKNMYR